MVCELHHFHSKFTSLVNSHAKLVEEFKDSVVRFFDICVGYYEGQRHCKMVIATRDHINTMYRKYQVETLRYGVMGRATVKTIKMVKERSIS